MKLSLSALLLAAVATPAIAQTQLPDAIVPTAYDITITPDAQALTFTGSETVAVTAKRATKTVVLKGSVPTAEQKTQAEAIARDKAEGYRIVNNLTVVPAKK